VYLVDDITPTSIADVYASPNENDWKEVLYNEIEFILSNGTRTCDMDLAHVVRVY
jgi:hypothetical protein